jgi:hypothetical protein
VGTNLTSFLAVLFVGIAFVAFWFLIYGVARLSWYFNIVNDDDVEDSANQAIPRSTEKDADQFVEVLRTGREVI